MYSLKIFSGVSSATFSISTPPSWLTISTEPLARAIEHDAEVELAFDAQSLLDQHALDHLPRRAGLVGDEIHAEDLLRGAEGLVGALDNLDAAALAAAAGMNLRLDDNGAAAEPLRHCAWHRRD